VPHAAVVLLVVATCGGAWSPAGAAIAGH